MMKTTSILFLFTFIYQLNLNSQAVYVDSNIGNDNNNGTEQSPVFSINKAMEIVSFKQEICVIRINPGIYILNTHITVESQKPKSRIVIEATVLPDDSTWTPEKMPVILSNSKKGEIMSNNLFIKDNWITAFYINESHVTIRGLKFLGYPYPANFYYPVARFNKTKTDLLIEQCMFIGDPQSSVIQAGIIAHGDSVQIDHCVFYQANNAAIFWERSCDQPKKGNLMTNCIVYGANVSAIWTASPDQDFTYKNNIVTDCNFVWIKDASPGTYSMDQCMIVNNRHFGGDENLNPTDFAIKEIQVKKEGKVWLRMINNVFEPWPKDHLHIIPDSPGCWINAGIFKRTSP